MVFLNGMMVEDTEVLLKMGKCMEKDISVKL